MRGLSLGVTWRFTMPEVLAKGFGVATDARSNVEREIAKSEELLTHLRESDVGYFQGVPVDIGRLSAQPEPRSDRAKELPQLAGQLRKIVDDYENGPEPADVRQARFDEEYPAAMATVRRFSARAGRLDTVPVPINGSVYRGMGLGYFFTPLRDGTRGYLMRRTDDCLQMALATALQISPELVPDARLLGHRRNGEDEEETNLREFARIDAFLARRNIKVDVRPFPTPAERRWIGVVMFDDDGALEEHCCVFAGRDALSTGMDEDELGPAGGITIDDVNYSIAVQWR